MNEYFEINRGLWNGWTPIHERSAFYDVGAFRAGALTLNAIETEQLGDVTGKRLLHLQCHFGLDTLSWARRGALVTGVDLSDRAIELAQSLAVEVGLDARFLRANVYDLPPEFSGQFDLVYTSYGAISWLPDLRRWATVIARCLRPGGSFHLVEFHPLGSMLDDEGRALKHAYFHSAEPSYHRVRGSYAEPDADFSHDSYLWSHSLSDVIDALLSAGLALRTFREFPYSPYNCFPFLEQREPGRWYVREAAVAIPLTYAIQADRP